MSQLPKIHRGTPGLLPHQRPFSPASPTSSTTGWSPPGSAQGLRPRSAGNVSNGSRSFSTPQLGSTINNEEKLIKLVDADPSVPSSFVTLQCRLPAMARSCGKYLRAYVVAMDLELLKARGLGDGLNPFKACRKKLIAQECLCAPRYRLKEECSRFTMELNPAPILGGKTNIILQVVVEAPADPNFWTPVGRCVEMKALAPHLELVILQDYVDATECPHWLERFDAACQTITDMSHVSCQTNPQSSGELTMDLIRCGPDATPSLEELGDDSLLTALKILRIFVSRRGLVDEVEQELNMVKEEQKKKSKEIENLQQLLEQAATREQDVKKSLEAETQTRVEVEASLTDVRESLKEEQQKRQEVQATSEETQKSLERTQQNLEQEVRTRQRVEAAYKEETIKSAEAAMALETAKQKIKELERLLQEEKDREASLEDALREEKEREEKLEADLRKEHEEKERAEAAFREEHEEKERLAKQKEDVEIEKTRRQQELEEEKRQRQTREKELEDEKRRMSEQFHADKEQTLKDIQAQIRQREQEEEKRKLKADEEIRMTREKADEERRRQSLAFQEEKDRLLREQEEQRKQKEQEAEEKKCKAEEEAQRVREEAELLRQETQAQKLALEHHEEEGRKRAEKEAAIKAEQEALEEQARLAAEASEQASRIGSDIGPMRTMVKVKVVRATGLMAADVQGTSDPYCLVRVAGRTRHGTHETFKTDIVKKTLEPVWEQEHTFDALTLADELTFEVFDHDDGKKDDLLGVVTLGPHYFRPEGFEGAVGLLRPQKGGLLSRGLTGMSNLRNKKKHEESLLFLKIEVLPLVRIMGAPRCFIKIRSAEHLRKADLGFGKSDPFCLVEVPGKPMTRFQTEVKKKTLSPVWDEEGEIKEYAAGDPLKLKVYDHDAGKALGDPLGEVVIPSSEFEAAGFDGTLRLGGQGALENSTLKVSIEVF